MALKQHSKYINPWLISFMITGLPVWFVSYESYLSSIPSYIASFNLLVFALLVPFTTSTNYRGIIISAIGGHLSAIIIRIFIDLIEDPTNHNLWPFEMAIYCFSSTIILVLGVAFSYFLKKIFSNS